MLESSENDPADDIPDPGPVRELLTPKELIASTIESLRGAKDTDVPLLDILSETILTMNPAETATVGAARAITALAAGRAELSNDDQPDND